MSQLIHPKRLFLIDGFGALLSAFLLGIVLTRYESYFGVPTASLIVLSILACFFAFYSLYHFKFFSENWNSRMKIIGIINLTYCLITAGVMVNLRGEITQIGILYFVIEILIVTSLAILELKTAFTTKFW